MTASKFPKNLIYIVFATAVSSYLISFALLQLAVGLLVILYLFEGRQEKRKAFDSVSLAIVVFGAIRLISIFSSEYFGSSIEAIQREILFYLSFLAFQFYLKSFKSSEIKNIAKFFVAAGFVVALIGIGLFVFTSIERAQSITSGYHTFADYLVVVLITALNYKPDKHESLIWTIGVGAVISAIIISMGRVSIALAGASVVLFAFIHKIKFIRLAQIIVIGAVLTLLSFQLNSADYVKTRLANPGVLSDRDVLYRGFGEIYAQHPILGFGPRTFRDVFPYLNDFADKNINSWHNDIFQIYIESGTLLLIAYFWLAFVIVRLYWKSKMLMCEDWGRTVKLGMFSGLAALFLTGLTSSVIFSPTLYLLTALLMAFVSTVYRRDSSS